MRLALAQIDPDGRRPRREPRADPRAHRGGAGGRRRPRRPPRARGHGLSAGGPAPAARASCAPRATRSSAIAAETRGIVALVGVPLFDGDLYNACAICRTARSRAGRGSGTCRTTASSTRSATSPPGDELALVEVAGTKVGITICEDMWVPGPPTTELVAAGAELVVNLSASPFHVGASAGTRGDLLGARAGERRSRRALQHGRRPGRAHLRRALALHRERRHACSRGRPASRRRCSSSTSSGRRRPGSRRSTTTSSRCAARSSSACATTSRRTASTPSSSASRAGSTPPSRRRSRSRRSAPSASTASRCRPATRPTETRADARRLAENLGCDFRELPIEPVVEAVHRRPRGVVRRARAGCRRGEPPGADPRDARDGALEQVRLAARRERQQVGAVGRLRDALRRHGRRLRAPQGRVQDGRLPARAAPERAGRARARPAVDDRPGAERRAARGPAATRTRCRRTPSWIACSRPTSRRTARSTS